MAGRMGLTRPARRALAGFLAAALSAGVLTLLTTGCAALRPEPMRISAQFPDSVGLYVGNNVDVLGIKVGTVTAIHPEGTHVLVDLAVDPGVKIPADAGAATVSPSVVTDRRVELTPVYRAGPTMRDGDLIPADRTHTPVEIDRVFAAADRLARALNGAGDNATAGPGQRPALADALGVAADDFRGNGDKVRQGIHGLAAAVGVGADQRDQLVDLIKNVDRLTGQAAGQDATIRRFTADLADATTLADQQGPALRRVLDNLDDLLDQTHQLITDNRDPAADTLANVRVTAHTLAGHTRDLSESLDVLPTLFQNLTNIADPARGAARAHISLEQPFLDTQLLQGACDRLHLPVLCAMNPQNPDQNATLALLLLGGAR
jgi:virulence factor Mce-like protein